MRRLGAHLGVEGMALYHYIHGREDLLDGIVELVIDDLYGDPDVHLAADPLAGLPATPRPRGAADRAGPSPGVPTGRDPPTRRAVGAAAAAQPAVDGIVPGNPAPVRVHRRRVRRRVPGVLQFPARSPAARGVRQGADVGPIEQADPDDKPTTDLASTRG